MGTRKRETDQFGRKVASWTEARIRELGFGRRLMRLTELAGGQENIHLCATTECDHVVFRFYRRNTSMSRIQDEVALLSSLAARGFPTPALAYHRCLEWNGLIAILLQYVAGRHPTGASGAYVVGELLGRLHSLQLAPVFARAPVRRYPRTIQAAKRLLAIAGIESRRIRCRIEELIEYKFGVCLPRQLIHNDAHTGNVLINGRSSYLLDMGDVEIDTIPQDIGRAAAHLHKRAAQPQIECLRSLLNGYEHVHPVQHAEREVLPRFVQYNIALYGLRRKVSKLHIRPAWSLEEFANLISASTERVIRDAFPRDN
jgi:Ser/Thr protein kinase RdoA (MazF antagonist)